MGGPLHSRGIPMFLSAKKRLEQKGIFQIQLTRTKDFSVKLKIMFLVLQRITEIAGVVVSLDPKPIPVSYHYHLLLKIGYSSFDIL